MYSCFVLYCSVLWFVCCFVDYLFGCCGLRFVTITLVGYSVDCLFEV